MITHIIRLNLLIVLYLLLSCNPAISDSGGDNWDAMIDGIKTFSADKKLNEEYVQLCRDNETAIVDGRYDTGGGLYMTMDVPVYSSPGKSRMTDLRDKAIVILTEDTALVEDIEWVKIKFLFISEYSGAVVAIDDGWIEKKQLRIFS